jgi:cellobiose-specific phosphotransferase system component IIB
MATAISVRELESKSHGSPDEVRSPAKTRVEIVRPGGFIFGRFNFEPGWRWSECIKPVVKTDSCQLSHAGHAVSGRMTVRMPDGTQKTIAAGESCTIPLQREYHSSSDVILIAEATSMSTEQNKAVVRRFIEAINAQDYGTLDEANSPELAEESSPTFSSMSWGM